MKSHDATELPTLLRIGLKEQPERVILGNAQGALTGLFMLWWAFLARNSGK